MSIAKVIIAGAVGLAGAAFPAAAESIAVSTPNGFTTAASASSDAHGFVVAHGLLCRRESAALRPFAIELERLGPNGEVLSSMRAPINGALGRSRGCGVFTIHTGWRLTAGETVRATTR
ncbi:MAG: hypothetical protein HY054_07880 [Proteobacteria bacterium]|nr:hypothetical protein [Pseudomonadota bacterium]